MRLKPFSLAAALLWAMAAQAQVPPPAPPGRPLEDPAQRALRERQDTERRREATQPAPQIAVAPGYPTTPPSMRWSSRARCSTSIASS